MEIMVYSYSIAATNLNFQDIFFSLGITKLFWELQNLYLKGIIHN